MNAAHLLHELEVVAAELSVEIRREDLEGSRGGLCRVLGQTCILLDRNLDLAESVGLMVHALARLPLDEVFIPPAVRELLENRAGQPH